MSEKYNNRFEPLSQAPLAKFESAEEMYDSKDSKTKEAKVRKKNSGGKRSGGKESGKRHSASKLSKIESNIIPVGSADEYAANNIVMNAIPWYFWLIYPAQIYEILKQEKESNINEKESERLDRLKALDGLELIAFHMEKMTTTNYVRGIKNATDLLIKYNVLPEDYPVFYAAIKNNEMVTVEGETEPIYSESFPLATIEKATSHELLPIRELLHEWIEYGLLTENDLEEWKMMVNETDEYNDADIDEDDLEEADYNDYLEQKMSDIWGIIIDVGSVYCSLHLSTDSASPLLVITTEEKNNIMYQRTFEPEFSIAEVHKIVQQFKGERTSYSDLFKENHIVDVQTFIQALRGEL